MRGFFVALSCGLLLHCAVGGDDTLSARSSRHASAPAETADVLDASVAPASEPTDNGLPPARQDASSATSEKHDGGAVGSGQGGGDGGGGGGGGGGANHDGGATPDAGHDAGHEAAHDAGHDAGTPCQQLAECCGTLTSFQKIGCEAVVQSANTALCTEALLANSCKTN